VAGVVQRVEDDAEHLHWRAVADPTRRRILDLLRTSPRTTGEIAAAFPISRIAVMRHLAVLDHAGLVVSRKRGRQRWHYVNLAPLMRLHERWSTPESETLAAGLLRFKDQVEGSMSTEMSTLDIAFDVPIAGTPERVYEALTHSPGAWWGHPYLRADATGLTLDARLGGHLLEVWDGGGFVMATITGLSSARWLQLTGPFHLGVATAVAEFDLHPDDGATRLAFAFRAVGLLDAGTVDAFRDAWRELLTVRLKALVDDGTRLGIDRG
jgi:DNA-binding transcriptional ArsR family regulator